MSNIPLSERMEIDRRKLEAKRKKLDRLLFEVGQTEGEIRIIESRLRYNETLAKERAEKTPEKKNEEEVETGLFDEPEQTEEKAEEEK